MNGTFRQNDEKIKALTYWDPTSAKPMRGDRVEVHTEVKYV
jgi:hypothetical protein